MTMTLKKVVGSDRSLLTMLSPMEKEERMVMEEKERQRTAAFAAEAEAETHYVDEGAIMMQSDPGDTHENEEDDGDDDEDEEDTSMQDDCPPQEESQDKKNAKKFDQQAVKKIPSSRPPKNKPSVLLSKNSLTLPKPRVKTNKTKPAPTHKELKQRQIRMNEQSLAKVCHSREYNENVLLKSFRETQQNKQNENAYKNDVIPTGNTTRGSLSQQKSQVAKARNIMLLDDNNHGGEDHILGAEFLLVLAGVIVIFGVIAYLFVGHQSA
jgi:hypothetical protein